MQEPQPKDLKNAEFSGKCRYNRENWEKYKYQCDRGRIDARTGLYAPPADLWLARAYEFGYMRGQRP